MGGNSLAVFVGGLLAVGPAGRDRCDIDGGGVVSKEVSADKGGAARWGHRPQHCHSIQKTAPQQVGIDFPY